MSKPHHRFIALDGLRGIAALAVVVLHTAQMAFYRNLPIRLPAALAVDFFFMLSGFVLAFAYFDKINTIGFERFMRFRLIRLYPLIPVGVLLGAILIFLRQHATGQVQPGEQWYNLPFAILVLPGGLISRSPSFNFTFDPPLWSLFFELLASAAFATRVRNLSGAWLALFLTVAAVVDSEVTYLQTVRDIQDDLLVPFFMDSVRTVFPFALGIAICRSGVWRNSPVVPIAWLALVLGIALLMPGQDGAAYSLCLLFLLFPVLLIIGARSKPNPQVSRVCQWVGDLSYPLYILHFPVSRMAIYISKQISSDVWVQSAVALGASIVVAAAALKLYDEPVRRWMSRINRPRTDEIISANDLVPSIQPSAAHPSRTREG